MELGRAIEAADGLAEILRLNPNDNQGVRYLLPELLARNGAWERARELLDRVGPDGTNLYTRCLVDIEAGRRLDALRWLCAAVSYNPHVPHTLLGDLPQEDSDPVMPHCVTIGGPSEALDYARRSLSLWRAGKGVGFLREVLQIEPFAERYARLLELERSLKGLPIGDERSHQVGRRYAIFGEDAVPTLVRECQAHFF